jgi:hypothetical protein
VFSDAEGGSHALAILLDHHALEDLNTLLVAFDNFVVHFECVAGAERREIFALELALDRRNFRIHHDISHS